MVRKMMEWRYSL